MFERASRLKVRFNTSRGAVTTEDLWDIPLIDPSSGTFSLDEIAKQLSRELKASAEESFVVKNTKNTVVELKFDIVKHVIDTKLAEIAANEKQVENKRKKERILAIIDQKQNAALEGEDLETLKGMLDE